MKKMILLFAFVVCAAGLGMAHGKDQHIHAGKMDAKLMAHEIDFGPTQ